MLGIVGNVESKFKELFKEEPLIVRSPGRVNLIGEHTDYNNGFVLPAAIDKHILLAVAPSKGERCSLYALDLMERFDFSKDNLCKSKLGWPNYLMGVVDQLNKAGFKPDNFNCVFGGDIPIGAGLSSSAAIEAGLAFALNHIFDLNISQIDLIKIAQKAENEFVGVRCGIMDQFVNIFGLENTVLKLDCRSLDYNYYPMDLVDYKILLCDTQVKHSLASSEYNKRRHECEEGVHILQSFNPDVKSLRDVTGEHLENHRSELGEVLYKRCSYVIQENLRVEKACGDLQKGDFKSFGDRLFQSHYGLRDEFEVSCRELDVLVEVAEKQEGILGARMMGGGFGGCTINLIKTGAIEEFKEKCNKSFKGKFNSSPLFYITSLEEGTNIINHL